MTDAREKAVAEAHGWLKRNGKRHAPRGSHAAAGSGVKEVEWAGPALEDMAVLDKGIARRVRNRREAYC